MLRAMPEDKQKNKNIVEWTQEEIDSTVSFFGLLLEVDKRLNPERYIKKDD